jgi:hypothetical protein
LGNLLRPQHTPAAGDQRRRVSEFFQNESARSDRAHFGRQRHTVGRATNVAPSSENFSNNNDDSNADATDVAFASPRDREVALAYPQPTPGKRTDLLQNESGSDAPSWRDLSQARLIVNEAPSS